METYAPHRRGDDIRPQWQDESYPQCSHLSDLRLLCIALCRDHNQAYIALTNFRSVGGNDPRTIGIVLPSFNFKTGAPILCVAPSSGVSLVNMLYCGGGAPGKIVNWMIPRW